MKSYRAIKFNVKKSDQIYEYCYRTCHLAKNVANVATYQIRQLMTGLKKDVSERTENEAEVIELYRYWTNVINEERASRDKNPYEQLTAEKWFPSKFLMTTVLNHSDNVDYYALPTNVSNAVISKIYGGWAGYFKLLKKYKQKKESLSGVPKPPGYIKSDVYTAVFNNCCAKFDNNENPSKIVFQKRRIDKHLSNASYDLKGRKLPDGKLIETRIAPKNDGTFDIEIVFEVETAELPKKENICRIVAIDIGIDNFAALTNNFGEPPILIDGKYLKSINRMYNKHFFERRELMNENQDEKAEKHQYNTKHMKMLSSKRNRRVEDFFHKAAKWIVDYCDENNVHAIVLGRFSGSKDETTKEKGTGFFTIPMHQFEGKLKYKAEGRGILFMAQEESFTTKASFLDKDILPTKKSKSKHEFSGELISNKLYKSAGSVLNSDVNASANILRKAFPEIEVSEEWIKGVKKPPVKIHLI